MPTYYRVFFIPTFHLYSRIPFLFQGFLSDLQCSFFIPQSLFYFKVPFHLHSSFPNWVPFYSKFPVIGYLYLHFGDMRSLILQGSFYILGLLFCTSSFSIQPFFSIQFLFCSRDPILFQSSVSIPKYPFISRVPFLFHGFFQFQFILLIYLTSSLHLGEYEH